MRAFTLPLTALAGAALIAPAAAQQATPAPAAPAGPAAPQTAAPATVTDAEVDQFATAVLAVDRINKDASIAADQKQTQMASAVTASGLTAERFNAIATSMSSDTALQAKVATAVQARAPQTTAPAAPAGDPAPAPAPAQ